MMEVPSKPNETSGGVQILTETEMSSGNDRAVMHLTRTNQELNISNQTLDCDLLVLIQKLSVCTGCHRRMHKQNYKSHKITEKSDVCAGLILWFCLSSRVTCSVDYTTKKAFSYKSQPHKYDALGFRGKASSKNGRTKARMGLYFLALEQRKGTESELLCNQS